MKEVRGVRRVLRTFSAQRRLRHGTELFWNMLDSEQCLFGNEDETDKKTVSV